MLKIKTLPGLPQPHPVAARTSLSLHSLNPVTVVNNHCFHFPTSHSTLTLFRLPPPHSAQRILSRVTTGSLTPTKQTLQHQLCLFPQHHFPFLFCCAFYLPILCFSRHSVLGSMLFFWLLNSLFSASSYKSTHPLSVGPQSLLTPHLVPRETDNYMTFFTTSIGFYLFHQNLASHQCTPVA